MLNDNEKEQLAKYKEIHSLSQKDKCSVSLVINTELNQIFIRKDIIGKKANIYNKLRDIDNIHLPKIHLLFEEECYITVIEEYIEGKTLQDILMSADAIEEVKLLDIIQQLCNVLNLLHNLPKPIIHRDIKPSNIIMSSSGIIKLIDFDASREYKSDASKDTISLGTVEYAAPEQFGYSQTDIRSDIYAVGMLILEFIKKAETQSYTYRHRASLKRIIDKCTMFDPNQRFQNINELLKEIEEIKGNRKIKQYIAYASFILISLTAISVMFSLQKNGNEVNTNTSHPITEDDQDGNTSNQDNQEFFDDDLFSNNDSSANENIQTGTSKDEIRNEDLSNNGEMVSSDIVEEQQGMSSDDKLSTSNNVTDNNSNTYNNQEEPYNMADTNQKINTEEVQSNTSNDKESSKKNDDIAKSEAPDETVTADNSANNGHAKNATVANYFIDYYKNPKHREDLKIYIKYNDASKVKYLSMMEYGRIKAANYSVEGNIITIKQDYLDTLPSGYYTLYIGMDVGSVAEMQFQVHDENEEAPDGEYRLSHYYREFYTSAPEDLTYLVYDINGAKLKTLWNDRKEIDLSYYQIEENGYVVTLFKEYMLQMAEGTICKLDFVFDNGEIMSAKLKVQNEPTKQPVFQSAENTFHQSSPENISFKVIWNDAFDITSITPQTEQTPMLTTNEYRWEEDVFVIKKDVLLKLPVGQYRWLFVFDTGFSNILTINILK